MKIIYVSAGRSGQHSLAVDSNGYVYSFGLNNYGQLGDGSYDNKSTPVLVLDSNTQTPDKYLGDEVKIIAVDAGISHSIALDINGHVWKWGYGSTTQTYPQKVYASEEFGGQPLSNIIQISSSSLSYAVDSNGNVWVWNAYEDAYKVLGGEMGTTYLENIAEVSAGGEHSMAQTNNGYVLEWINGGSPEYVRAGEMETQSGLLEGIISINVGYTNFEVAVDKDGYGWGWGANGHGELGVGDNDSRLMPAKMLCAVESNSIYLTKTHEIQGDNPDCARPFDSNSNNYLVFEICYGNPVTNQYDPNYYGIVYDVNIIEHLPIEVNFYSADGNYIYDSNTRIVRWSIGELSPGEMGCLTLTTKVNTYAQPGGEISNFVEMTADYYYAFSTDTLPVCNWDGTIIYVDRDANGYNNGTNWNDAYTDLQVAFERARELSPDIAAIWVAAGTYKPVNDISVQDYKLKSFELIDNIALIGHFGGVGTYETSPDQRNLADANKETILEGKIGQNYDQAVNYIVKGQSIDSAVIDGFTIKGSYDGAGIYLVSDADVSIMNCTIKDNADYGIRSKDFSHPDIYNCVFMDNSYSGAYFEDYCWPEITDCIFDGNEQTGYGIYMVNFVVSISNTSFNKHTSYGIYGDTGTLNIIGSTSDSDYTGIRLNNDVTTIIADCCIINSGNEGIYGNNSDLSTNRCFIDHIAGKGVHLVNHSNLSLENSIIRYCGDNGLELSYNFATTIKNNWIHNNNGAGISFTNQVSEPLVRNNTIYDNAYGIWSSSQGADPNIINCIIYGNDTNDLYRESGVFNNVNYCLLQNTHSGTGNKTGSPGFLNPSEPNDLHISDSSQCKNAGNPNGNYINEYDIDGESRVADGRVDIGGDEYYFSKSDYNKDEIVDFKDFAFFGNSWQDQNAAISLDDDNDVDINDLALFCEDWLWQLVWVTNPWFDMSFGDSGGMSEMALQTECENDSIDVQTTDSLPMTDIKASMDSRPARLRARSQKFYDITPETTVRLQGSLKSESELAEKEVQCDDVGLSAEQIQELIDWTEELWMSNPELRDMVGQDGYDLIMESLKEQLDQ